MTYINDFDVTFDVQSVTGFLTLSGGQNVNLNIRDRAMMTDLIDYYDKLVPYARVIIFC